MEERYYAAAAAWDYALRKAEQPGETRLLVLDLSELEGALCLVSGAGEVEVRELLPSSGKGEFFSRLAAALGRSEDQSYSLWREQLRDSKRKLTAFLKNREHDYPVLQETGAALTCADLAGMYEQDEARTKELLRAAEEMLRRSSVDSETIRILLCGRAASFLPAEYTVRAFFDPDDPWMADDRFAQPDPDTDPALLAQKGEEILRELENSPFGHDVAVICFANIGSGEALPEYRMALAGKDQRKKSMAEPSYKGELFLSDRTKLTLSIDGERVSLPLRDRGIYEGIYRAGLRVVDKQPELCLQRTNDPTDVVTVPIRV